jgi:hypothetical protein
MGNVTHSQLRAQGAGIPLGTSGSQTQGPLEPLDWLGSEWVGTCPHPQSQVGPAVETPQRSGSSDSESNP